jgi:hypothetical protein
MIPESKDNAQQILLWVNGKSTHCRFGYGKEDYECCPDFSCCHPDLLRPREEREQFMASNKAERHRMLGTYLAAFLEHTKTGAVKIG